MTSKVLPQECKVGLTFKINQVGNSLVVQWLGLGTFTDMGLGSIPGRGTKIPQTMLCRRKHTHTHTHTHTHKINQVIHHISKLKKKKIYDHLNRCKEKAHL